MPTEMKVQTPKGVIKISVPDGATEDQILGFAKQEYERQNPPPVQAQQEPDYATMGPVEIGMEALRNTPGSAMQFAEDITAPIHSPIQTGKALWGLSKGLVQLPIPGEQGSEDNARQAWEAIKGRYGSPDAAIKTFATDPVGFISDAAGILTGGASIAAKVPGKVGRIAAGAGKIAQAVEPATLASRAVGRVMNPSTPHRLKTLMDEGISPTVPQVIGGPIAKMEEKISSVPVLGDVMGAGRTRSWEQLTRAAFNRALNPIGKNADDIPVNREGLGTIYKELGDSYDSVLGRVEFSVDDILMEDISSIIDEVVPVLTKEESGKLNNIVAARVFGRLAGESDAIIGKNLKMVQSDLLKLAKKHAKGSPGEAEIGGALKKIRTAIHDSIIRHNPDEAVSLKNIDKGYLNYKILEDAFKKAGDMDDGLTPAKLDAAVRASGAKTSPAAVARGAAPMQDLSQAGVSVLGSTIPNSGTTDRALMMGLGSPALLSAVDPTSAILAAVGSAAYIPKVQKYLGDLIARRSPQSRAVGETVQQYGPTISRAMHQSGRYGERQDPYLLKGY